eukprot:365743-Chlamydomonas_euryale.AAC.18
MQSHPKGGGRSTVAMLANCSRLPRARCPFWRLQLQAKYMCASAVTKRVMDRGTTPIALAGDWESMPDAMDEDALDAAIAAVNVCGAQIVPWHSLADHLARCLGARLSAAKRASQ